MNSLIATSKIKALFLLHESAQTNVRATSRLLKLSRNTVKKYLVDIRRFLISTPPLERSLGDYLKFLKNRTQPKKRAHILFQIFPEVIVNILNNGSTRLLEWKKYRDSNPKGYSYTQFTTKLVEYCKEHDIKIISRDTTRVKSISSTDYEVLVKWKKSNNKWKWERATVLLGSLEGNALASLSRKIERGRKN